ncbi:MAG: hypothetical protein IKZ21_05380 [Clostridia bacterium]|nr:hypothetical protein [Clostridia bacterium]
MKYPIPAHELAARIQLNFDHLKTDPYYGIGQVFSPEDYSWYGDKEGRVLLSFVSHYKISGQVIPCMEELLAGMPARLNEEGYFGPLYRGKIHEEQLSGHSWLLRGLAEHYQAFGAESSLAAAKRIVQNLYLPLRGKIGSYPLDRDGDSAGGVSGEMAGEMANWLLSTDIGCAFMSIDGLSHVYQITGDGAIRELLDEMIDFYRAIDKVKLKAQTHCTLTAARGMLRMYAATGERRYLLGAEEICKLYVDCGGMTKTYQNLNWWGREDSWTEPCAIVDSLMVATELYKITQKSEYRTLAARIWHNGLATAQRDNGGAGTDTLICPGSEHRDLHPLMYEAFFCCSMRLSEGLWYVNENRELLWAETAGRVEKQENGTYADGDLLYALPEEALLPYAEAGVEVDGMTLYPIVKGYKVPGELLMGTKQQILFD